MFRCPLLIGSSDMVDSLFIDVPIVYGGGLWFLMQYLVSFLILQASR